MIFWSKTAEWLGLAQHREWIGVVFLVSATIVVAQLASLAWQGLATRKNASSQLERLKSLTASEKQILSHHISINARTCDWKSADEAVISLTESGILKRVDRKTYDAHGVYYSKYLMAEWAWQYLTKHREILE